MERPEAREKTLPEKLFEDRILFMLGELTEEVAAQLVMSLLYLESLDPDQDIFLYIHSPGGSVTAGLSVYDTMNLIQCDVWTICTGMAASMGAILLSGGTKGKRVCMPNAKVMIHQPLQGIYGYKQATEVQIAAKEILRTRERLNQILSEHTNQPVERIHEDTERDYWMTAQESLEYGLVDSVVKTRQDISLLVKGRT